MSAPALITDIKTLTDPKIALAIFTNERTSKPEKQGSLPWPKACKALTLHTFRENKSGKGYVPAKLIGSRANKNVERVSLAVMDSDQGVTVDEGVERLQGYDAVLYTTHSHSADHPKWRGVIRLAQPVKPEDFHAFRAGLVDRFGQDINDPQCNDPARFYYFPSCPEEKAHLRRTETLEGAALDPAPLIDRGREILRGSRPPVTLNHDLGTGTRPLQLLENPENIAMVKGLLAVLDAGCDRRTWRNIGWALASLGWACGFDLFDEWSKTTSTVRGVMNTEPYDRAETLKVWNSYRPGGIGFGTLVHLAKEADWVDTRKDSVRPEISELNQRYAVIEAEHAIFDIPRGRFVNRAGFQLQHANKKINTGSDKKPYWTDLGAAWPKDEGRRTHSGLKLAPGQPEVLPGNELNTWKGFTFEATEGDPELFLKLSEYLIPDTKDRRFVLTWLARLIQYPAEKFHVALVVWSSIEGTGKNLFFESVGRLFDERHHRVVGSEVFTDQFNEWQSFKVFIIADEVSAAGDRKTADKVKAWMTSTNNNINVKNSPKHEEANLIKYAFLSNHPDAVSMSDHDRRYYVVEAARKRLPTEFATKYAHWRDNGGLGIIRHYLECYETSGFDPKAPAPMNRAKAEMIEDNRSDLERWLNTILTAADISNMLGRELCTADEFATKYEGATGNNVSTKTVTLALRKAGIIRLDKQARCKNGKRPRVYALQNFDRWQAKTEADLGIEMDKPFVHFWG